MIKVLYGSIGDFAALVRQWQAKDFDWFHLCTGGERSGKTTLGFRMCYAVDPEFSLDKIVFTAQDFRRVASMKAKRSAIMIDEGAVSLFSREAMRYETRELIKVITVLGHKNHFVCINVPDPSIVDTYIRTFRCASLSRTLLVRFKKETVPRRGWALFYNAKKSKNIRKDVTGKVIWPPPSGLVKFGKIKPEDGRLYTLWRQYLKVSNSFKTNYERGKKDPDNRLENALKDVLKNRKYYLKEYKGRKFLDAALISDKHGLSKAETWRVKKRAEAKLSLI